MSKTHFGLALNYQLRKTGMTQTQIAEKAGMAQASVSQIIGRPKRPDVDTLKALCNCWPTPAANLYVLIEHLRDEIARSGHHPKDEIGFRPLKLAPSQVERDLELLTQQAMMDEAMAGMLHQLAEMARKSQAWDKPSSLAADADGNGYGSATPKARKRGKGEA